MNPILKNALINAVGATAYIVAVASFLFYATKTFGPANTVLIPIMMLMLLVFSVALMGGY